MSISAAIKNRQLIKFSYDGFSRTAEPHTYGVDGKGHEALRAYQVSGGSESGEFQGWKLFHVNEMYGLEVTKSTFSFSRPDYKRGDKAFNVIYAEL